MAHGRPQPLQGLLAQLLRLHRHQGHGQAVPAQLLPAFTAAGASPVIGSQHQHQQTRLKRTVRVVLKRDDPITGAREGDVLRVPAGRQRLDLFPAGAADYATPRVLREARAASAAAAVGLAPTAAADAGVDEGAAAAATGAGGDEDDAAASLQRAVDVLETGTVVLRRRGTSGKGGDAASSAAAAAPAAAAAAGGGESGSSGGGGGRMVGRVSRADVARAVSRQLGVALDDRLVMMGDEGIRAFGEYRVPLNVASFAGAGAGAGGGGGGGGGGAGSALSSSSSSSASLGAAGGSRRQAHVRVDVVRTWR